MPSEEHVQDAAARRLARFAADRRGATAIEYGLIAALIAAVCIAGISALGAGSGGMWDGMAEKVVAAMTGA